MAIQRKTALAQTKEMGPRQVQVVCSSAQVDRMGEIVVQDGIDLSAFQANPVCLWSHDPTVPIGRATNIGLRGGVLQADVEFAPEGISAKADEICALVKAGIISTVSIGFQPIETEPMDPGRPRGAQKYLKSSLMELSFVSVPANTDANVVARDAQDGAPAAEPAPQAPVAHTAAVDRKKAAAFVAGLRRKDLYDVGYLASVLGTLGWIVDDVAWEAAWEGDGSKVPGMLADAMQAVADALLAMTEEEVAEALADARSDVAAAEGDGSAVDVAYLSAESPVAKAMGLVRFVTRAGRVLSAANETDLRAAHDKIGGVLAQVGQQDEGADPDTAEKAALEIRRRELEVIRLRAL